MTSYFLFRKCVHWTVGNKVAKCCKFFLVIPFCLNMAKIYLKNSKVFEQKGDLISFKVDIDPKSGLMLSNAELSWVE